jgi:acyl-CoA synthetase (AMP-forming)/AMP-acid ligase II
MITESPTTYQMAIIDSTAIGTNAATISNQNTPSTTDIVSVSSGSLLTYTSGTTTLPTPTQTTRSALLSNTAVSSWVRTNTLSDMSYLYANSGSTLAGAEYTMMTGAVTIPAIASALCSSSDN